MADDATMPIPDPRYALLLFGEDHPDDARDRRRRLALERAIASGRIPGGGARRAYEEARRRGIDVVEDAMFLDRTTGTPLMAVACDHDVAFVPATVADLALAYGPIQDRVAGEHARVGEAVRSGRCRPQDLVDVLAHSLARIVIGLLGRVHGDGEGATTQVSTTRH